MRVCLIRGGASAMATLSSPRSLAPSVESATVQSFSVQSGSNSITMGTTSENGDCISSEANDKLLQCVSTCDQQMLTGDEIVKKRRSRRGGRKKKRQHGAETALPAKECDVKMADEDEVIYCLKPHGVSKHSAPDKLAKELMRCLKEIKYMLILDVINVLGVDRTLNLFYETASIQENGGQITTDGTRRKNPGGVFFSLVKRTATADEQKAIFQKDKKLQVQRKRDAQRRRIEEREKKNIEHDREVEELRRLRGQEKNIYKRLYGGNTSCEEVKLEDSKMEDMEVQQEHSEQLVTAQTLAEQFELMSDTDLNIAVEV